MDINVTKQTATEIQRSSEKLGEVRDIANAILATGEISDEGDRMTIIYSLARRLLDIGLESSVIWVKAHDILNMAKKEEEATKTPEQELTELEDTAEDDLPFC